MDFSKYGFDSAKRIHYWNFGDQVQMLALQHLYEYMGINPSEVISIPSAELGIYDGDEVILPINICELRTQGDNYQWLSKKVHPVFLGVDLQVTLLTKSMVDFFKEYQPIGCRDETTYSILLRNGIRCYLNGCLTSTFTRRSANVDFSQQQQVYFVDIPDSLIDYIPRNIAANAKTISNNFYGSINDLVPDGNVMKFIVDRYETLRETASLVVTSRLHVASPCIAMGIPVILAKNDYPSTFSWIDKVVPMYSKEHFSEIDWNPKATEYESTKELMLQLAANRLRKGSSYIDETADKITDFWLQRDRKTRGFGNTIFETLLSLINEKWDKISKIEYSIWGVNDIAEALYYYLAENYPNAVLKAVYDKYNDIVFHGVASKRPQAIAESPGEFVIVCVMTAMVEAEALFKQTGKNRGEYCLPVSIDKNLNMHIIE
jgi:hypothetical protein